MVVLVKVNLCKLFIVFRFGTGYSITLVVSSTADVGPAQAFVQRNFSNFKNLKIHRFTILFSVECDEIGKILKKIFVAGNLFNLQDFSIKQTTLDEVTT